VLTFFIALGGVCRRGIQDGCPSVFLAAVRRLNENRFRFSPFMFVPLPYRRHDGRTKNMKAPTTAFRFNLRRGSSVRALRVFDFLDKPRRTG